MSELKAHWITTRSGNPLHCYLKSQADKVIAEKDKKIAELKEMMPKYKQFIEDEDYRKKLVDEYDGYVYEWKGHRYIVTPYLNTLVKGILRALWVTRTAMAKSEKDRWNAHVDCGERRNRKDPTWVKTGKRLEVSEWRKLWEDNERRCKALAEQYKEEK